MVMGSTIVNNGCSQRRCFAQRCQHISCGRARTIVLASVSGVEQKVKPDWTGDTLLSAAVNAFTQIPVVKMSAKQFFKYIAHQQGVDWMGNVRELEAAKQQLESIKSGIEDASIVYPDYYTRPFHSYDEGNLNWLAAQELESATLCTAWRAFKDPALTPPQAHVKLRGNTVAAIKAYQQKAGCRPVEALVDIGCSVGMSTAPLAEAWPTAAVTGLDLSPYFLAVAAYRQQQNGGRVNFVHGAAESPPLPAGSMDLVAIQFMVHECTAEAIANILVAARQLLRPGGTLAVVDINPGSPVIQGLPPAIFTLMKSTEPNMDSYVSVDMKQAVQAAGFTAVDAVEVDSRHYAVLGKAAAQ